LRKLERGEKRVFAELNQRAATERKATSAPRQRLAIPPPTSPTPGTFSFCLAQAENASRFFAPPCFFFLLHSSRDDLERDYTHKVIEHQRILCGRTAKHQGYGYWYLGIGTSCRHDYR
jgi:hypothetical protein